MKSALVTGIFGQDGHYLHEHLLRQGYFVYGMTRRQIVQATHKRNTEYIYGDLTNEASLDVAIRKSWPDEIYNLGGQVFVPTSWDYPGETFDVNTAGLARILKIVENVKPNTKVYQASSSEMFGNHNGACSETTPLRPMSPYGVSKASSHRLCALYRERGLFVVSGMLFNHESPFRGPEMVTRKIARHVAGWANGDTSQLCLGNIMSRRDWGFAGDYVEAMYLMLQQEQPEDFVIGTEKSHSVQEFLYAACDYLHIDREFVNKKLSYDENLMRTQEIHGLYADASKAHTKLGWSALISFKELVAMMVKSEWANNKAGVTCV